MSSEVPDTGKTISRRTIAKGVAWATPAVAVAAATPAYAASVTTTTSTTRPPCVDDLAATGGTYPVTVALSGCSTADSHWDFNFKITASEASPDCQCGGAPPTQFRVTLFDNPKRSRLWIQGTTAQNNTIGGNPTTNTSNSHRLFVQKILAPGATATFPDVGDMVRRVGPQSGFTNYTSYQTESGTADVGPITAHGTANDSMHVLVLPGGGLPTGCTGGSGAPTGPMAYYRVECRSSPTGTWTQLGGIGQINECVPMISATVCRFDEAGNDRYRLRISVLNDCGIPRSNFVVTNIQRNNDTNFPSEGTSVWDGYQPLNDTTTDIYTTIPGNSGGQLWITFTADGGANTSQRRVPINNTACTGTCTLPGVPGGRGTCRVSGNTATGIYRYTWNNVSGATSYDVRYSTATSGDTNWTTAFGVTSPYTTVQGVRRLQVRAVNSCGNGAWSATTSVSGSTGTCTTGFAEETQDEAGEPPANRLGAETESTSVESTTTESTTSETTESSTTETTESTSTPSESTDQ